MADLDFRKLLGHHRLLSLVATLIALATLVVAAAASARAGGGRAGAAGTSDAQAAGRAVIALPDALSTAVSPLAPRGTAAGVGSAIHRDHPQRGSYTSGGAPTGAGRLGPTHTQGRTAGHRDHPARVTHEDTGGTPSRAAWSVASHATAAVLAFGSGYRLRGGSSSVRRLQRRLAAGGFAPGPIDGLYGPLTAGAVARFEATTGLPVDGTATPRTIAALFSSVPVLYPGAGERSGGSRLVRGLQELLARSGYHPHGIDGRYGPLTEAAVRRFQAAHGLQVDGIAHPQVFADLRNAVGARRQVHAATHSAPPPTAVPARIPAATNGEARRTGGPSIALLALLAAVLGVMLSIALTRYSRGRRGAPAGVAPHLREVEGETTASEHSGNGASATPRSPRPHPPAATTAEDGTDADATFSLGVLLEEQGNVEGAEAAYRRADTLGHPAAASNLGVLLEQRGDRKGARAAYRRADERGEANGAFNLGVLLEAQGDPAGAEAAYRRADQRGHAAAASNLGVLLEGRGDQDGAEAAYRRADERGEANGAFNLGVLLEERGDMSGADAAYRRAEQSGDTTVAQLARAAMLDLVVGVATPDGGRDHRADGT